jgi:hypothetical protein
MRNLTEVVSIGICPASLHRTRCKGWSRVTSPLRAALGRERTCSAFRIMMEHGLRKPPSTLQQQAADDAVEVFQIRIT